MPTRLGSILVDKMFLGDIKISKGYLNGQLIFDGEQWIWCLMDSEGNWLETKNGDKLQPKLEGK